MKLTEAYEQERDLEVMRQQRISAAHLSSAMYLVELAKASIKDDRLDYVLVQLKGVIEEYG